MNKEAPLPLLPPFLRLQYKGPELLPERMCRPGSGAWGRTTESFSSKLNSGPEQFLISALFGHSPRTKLAASWIRRGLKLFDSVPSQT
jgi:hypothetical protein